MLDLMLPSDELLCSTSWNAHRTLQKQEAVAETVSSESVFTLYIDIVRSAKHSLSQSAGPSSQAFQLDDEYEDDAQIEEEEDEDEPEPETVRKSARKRKSRTGGQ